MGTNTVEQTGSIGRSDELHMPPENLRLITDPGHPLYDPRISLPLKEDFVLDVKERGVRERISARRNGKSAAGKDILEVTKGRQRVRAALEANRRLKAEGSDRKILVPVKVVRASDREIYEDIIKENELRHDTPPTMRAMQAQKMLNFGASEEEVSKMFRYETAQGFRLLLRLLDLDEAVQRLVDAGEFPASLAAEELTKFDRNPGTSGNCVSQQLQEAQKILAAGLRGELAKETLRQRHKAQGKPASETKEHEELVKRLRTRRQVEAFLDALKGKTGKDVEIAVAVAKWFLGSDRSFTNLPRLRAAAKGEE